MSQGAALPQLSGSVVQGLPAGQISWPRDVMARALDFRLERSRVRLFMAIPVSGSNLGKLFTHMCLYY